VALVGRRSDVKSRRALLIAFTRWGQVTSSEVDNERGNVCSTGKIEGKV